MGTLLALIMPALFPHCHKLKECGSFFTGVDEFPELIEDSSDGIIECEVTCNGQSCKNNIGYPIGKLAVEIKCPFSPLKNPTMLPVSYKMPHYNACQVLTDMFVTKTTNLLFASCSPESLSVTIIDFDHNAWDRLFSFCKEMYADAEISKPNELQPESLTLKEEIKKYSNKNCLLVAEVPTLVTFDDEYLSTSPMPEESKKMYRHRKTVGSSTPDWKELNESIVDLCNRNIKVLEKANESLRRKATELLLFVASDSNREFCKDVPNSIPIAYGLKGKSIRVETAKKMIDVVQNKLNENNINVLAESLDGQWAQIVFRDSSNNPLAVYEFDKDCWIKFAKLGKHNILKYLETFSHIHFKNIEGLSKPERFDEGRYQNGNIGFDVDFRFNKKKEKLMFLSCYSFCGELNIHKGLKKLRTPLKNDHLKLWGSEMDIDGSLLHILGYKKVSRRLGETSSKDENNALDGEAITLRHDMVAYNAEYDADDEFLEYSQNFMADTSVNDCSKIKHLVLHQHRSILETFIIVLLCLDETKWKSTDIEDLYNSHLTSTQIIYKSFLSKELSELINIIRELCGKQFKIPKCENKVDKANTLGYIFGHYQ